MTATILFPVKGHTHGPLDAIGGQAVTRCSHMPFDDPNGLVDTYQQFLSRATFEEGTFSKTCYKHDNSADWNAWINDIPLKFANHTGPMAPHGFRVLKRKRVMKEEVEHAKYHCANPSPNDIMMLLYHYMSDALPYQVVRLFSNLHSILMYCFCLQQLQAYFLHVIGFYIIKCCVRCQ